MKKGKLFLCLAAITSVVTSCGFDETVVGSGEWDRGGIAFLPLLWSPTEEGDCHSIIEGWIDSCAEHGVTIKGHDNPNVQDAMNSQTWTVEFDSDTNDYYSKIGILSNSLGTGTSGLQALSNQCKAEISLHLPEYIVVPCFASEIYAFTGLNADYPDIKIGAYSAWFGDETMSKFGEQGTFEFITGQSTCYNLPMLHLLINAIDGEFEYTDKISLENIRNYNYQGWTSMDKETFKEMVDLSLDTTHPSITKAMLDEVVPDKTNGKSINDFQSFLDEATYEYLSSDEARAKEDNTKETRSDGLKIGLIELNATSSAPAANTKFLKEYGQEYYGVQIQEYKNDGSGVTTLVNRAINEGCKGIMINATDTDIVDAAITACNAGVYTCISNSEVYASRQSLLVNADANGNISKYYVGAYGVGLDDLRETSKSMVDGMFDRIEKYVPTTDAE